MLRAEFLDGWRRIWIVALREIRERGGSRSYRISTVASVLLIIAVIVLPSFAGQTKTHHVGLAGAVPLGTATALTAQANAADQEIDTRRYRTVAEGEHAVRDREVDVLLIDGNRLEWRGTPDSTLTAAIANAVQAVHIREQADRLGISAEEVARLLVPVTLTSRSIGTAGNADEDANTVGFIAVGALFMMISFYAGFVLTGVVQEKSNRVAEVLLARMPARQVLAGKVLGIGAVGLTQFALIAVTAGITVQVTNQADAPNISGDVLAWTVVWFVLGYLLYSVVYAALGATTSRIEDAQSAIAPVTGLLILSYLAVLYTQDNPDAPATVVLSYFPATAPMVMTYRLALGAVPTWQVISSALLMAVVIWALVRIAGRVYSGALLRLGGRIPLRDVWRSTAT
ncbi:MAG TPA: ABC transporter permease [Mycobacteriales bacterium]